MTETNAALNKSGDVLRSRLPRGPLWMWLLVSIALLAGVGYLRLIQYSDRFVPLAGAVILLTCLWHRDFRLLWAMAVSLFTMILYKAAFLLPAGESLAAQWLYASMQFINVAVVASVVHLVIRLTGRLEHAVDALEQSNEELEASNEELAAREEEITQQNEELQSQTEELEQQTEELNAQTEELQMLNEQVTERERSLADLLEVSAGGANEEETIEKLSETIQRLLGERAEAAAILEAEGDEMVVRPVFGIVATEQRLPRSQTLADLVLGKGRAGSLADIALREDIIVPQLASGAVGSFAAGPMHMYGDVDGVLEVYSTSRGDWSPHELRIVQWLADQCGRALATARLKAERENWLESEQQARAIAEAANHAKDEFVATLSHELRTPLAAVLGWASLLRKNKDADLEEMRKGIEVIERNARHQNQLLSDLLDTTRIVSGKVSLDVSEVDLIAVVENALESVRLAAESKGVRLERNLGAIDRVVTGDESRLQQVVWNLLSNAIKFTPRGGCVSVELSRVASYVQIKVSDDGEGIDTNVLPHLFERYRQADGSDSRRHGGLGLGLSIAKSLVELHGGSIEAMSDGLGKGATFAVLLPVAAAVESESARKSPRHGSAAVEAPDRPVLNGLSILVLDDDPDAREVVGHILRRSGAEVQAAASGREALAIVDESPPHIVVSDIGMPEMDGYTFIRKLREQWPEDMQQPPAIALTAFARSEERTRALRAGFQSHIAKPVEAAELVATISSLRYSLPTSRK